MIEKKIDCDNCGSKFTLTYLEEEVSYQPENCPFCGDLFDNDRFFLEDFDSIVGDDLDEESSFGDDHDIRRH